MREAEDQGEAFYTEIQQVQGASSRRNVAPVAGKKRENVVYSDDEKALADTLCEFLEAAVHQIVFVRGIYSPELFAKERVYGTFTHRCRHPWLCEYIHDVTHSLKPALLERSLHALVVNAVDHASGAVLERVRLRTSILVPCQHDPAPSTGHVMPRQQQPTTSAVDAAELRHAVDAQLRAIMQRLHGLDAALPPLPAETRFELTAECTTPDGVASATWAEDPEPEVSLPAAARQVHLAARVAGHFGVRLELERARAA